MGAEVLREAVVAIRADWDGATPDDGKEGYTLSYVADWLDEVADFDEAVRDAGGRGIEEDDRSMRVARAYLGRDA